MLVCNYGPGGNILSQPVYVTTTGAAGSGCAATQDDGLCEP